MVFIIMKTILICIVFSLIIGCVSTYRYELDSNVGAVVKYRHVDYRHKWVELGVEKKRKRALIYVPLAYEHVYKLGDTITLINNEPKEEK
jgi:hypothetical protein